LAVAEACGDTDGHAGDAAAASIELLHCASLVHDDLPCFDDADTRRGLPSVHKRFGEPLAVLAGDALIVLAFETLAHELAHMSPTLVQLMLVVGRAVGAPHGIVAGQAWESEPTVLLETYQRAKTGSLFVAATTAGAIAAGSRPEHWQLLGERLGEAYQVADDLCDEAGTAATLGKPIGQDKGHGRPSAAISLGVDGSIERVERLLADAVAAIPPCAGAAKLRSLVRAQAHRLIPSHLLTQRLTPKAREQVPTLVN